MPYLDTVAGEARDNLNAGATSAPAELTTLAAAIPTAAVADLASYTAGTNTTAVPGSFADLPAVVTYLTTLRAEIETRLDALDIAIAADRAKINDLLAKLRVAGIVTP